MINFRVFSFFLMVPKVYFRGEEWRAKGRTKERWKVKIKVHSVSSSKEGTEVLTSQSCPRSDSRRGRNRVQTPGPARVITMMLKLYLDILFLRGLNHCSEILCLQDNSDLSPPRRHGRAPVKNHNGPLGYFHHARQDSVPFSCYHSMSLFSQPLAHTNLSS